MIEHRFYEIEEGVWSTAAVGWVDRDDLPEDSRLIPLRDLSDLRQTMRFYCYPLGELAEDADRRKEILAELDEIDRESIRPLRAIDNGDDTTEDHQKLIDLEARAVELRTEMAGLE